MIFDKLRDRKFSSIQFVKFGLRSIFLILVIIATINFLVDPYYQWGYFKVIDLKRKDFDERIQKTNYLANINNNYNAILLGNSRSTYLDVRKFDLGVNIFNSAVNAMSIYEYDQLITNFIKLTGKDPEIILIGIDHHNFKGDNPKRLETILEELTSNSLKLKNLLSLDIFRFSLETIEKTIRVKLNLKDLKQRYYNNQLVKGNDKENFISNEKYIKDNSTINEYIVQNELLEEYKRLKNKYSKSKFIIYCLPFHKDLLDSWIYDIHFYDKNQQFISNLIDIFGEVYYFNYISKYNSSYTNYYDKYHFYPFLGNILIDNFNNLQKNRITEWGYLLNKDNYKSFMK